MSDRPKWTPGPWEQYVAKGYDIATIGKNLGDGRGLLHVAEVPNTSDEREANARLIAAAPELYEALVGVMALIEQGKLRRNTSDDPNPDWAMRQIPFVRALAAAEAVLAKARGTSPE